MLSDHDASLMNYHCIVLLLKWNVRVAFSITQCICHRTTFWNKWTVCLSPGDTETLQDENLNRNEINTRQDKWQQLERKIRTSKENGLETTKTLPRQTGSHFLTPNAHCPWDGSKARNPQTNTISLIRGVSVCGSPICPTLTSLPARLTQIITSLL